jgi:hypothetical protein
MKKLFLSLSIISLAASLYLNIPATVNTAEETKTVATLLDNWHAAAGRADYNAYFDKIADNGHYMGTDATQNWDKKAFAIWAKPYFDKGKAWNFKALDRHMFFSADGKTAWFDELLDTQMKICRGSGVLTKEGKNWKIQQYVLSMTVPNEVVDDAVPLKAKYEDAIIEKLKAKNKN